MGWWFPVTSLGTEEGELGNWGQPPPRLIAFPWYLSSTVVPTSW